jgi:3-phenylpropionate/trans-cinnamate dioxygenase ferredoxin reductase subunit
MTEPGDTPSNTIVIIGAGQAGGETAAELRRRGFSGRVVVIGDEPFAPYRRPALSKGYLGGAVGEETLYLMPPAALLKNRIEFIGQVAVARIDRVAKQVLLADGRAIAYDRLALTTGGRARRLTLPGADKPNVFTLRGIADVQAIKALCAPGKHAVIVGGGFIGLEAAATLVGLGLKVTVLEGLPRVLARVSSAEVSHFFERVHREAGVDLRTGVAIERLEGNPQVNAVLLGDGSRIACDFVIAGIGLIPSTELAESAGLVVENGIVVNEFCRTSDPHIVAAGDCANHLNSHFGRRLRLESVQNAMEQGRAAAAALLDTPVAYAPVPWFWSDQYDLKLQMVGLSEGYDQLIVRGDLSGRSFAIFYLLEHHLIAADVVNRATDFTAIKKLVALRERADPAALADEAIPIKSLLPVAA